MRAVVTVALVASLALPASAATVRGRVAITGKRAKALDPSRAVVWLSGRGEAVPPKPERTVMTTRGKKFLPEVLVVPAGSRVAFPNEDSIQHNVFSSSEGNVFDVGLYGPGPGTEVVLRTPGIVRVYCNVHPQMAAFVVVTPTALAARVKADGTFVIDGVPPGAYELEAWDERGGRASAGIEVRGEAVDAPELTLDGSLYKKTPHLDKHGRPYEEREEADYP